MIAAGAAIYYLIPGKLQWVELLVLSVVFYMFAAVPYTFIYVIVSTTIAWIVTNCVKHSKAAVGISIAVDIVLWFMLKGTEFITAAGTLAGLIIPAAKSVVVPQYAAALGMGYYTLQIIGYTLDCLWDRSEPQKNPLKLLLFTCFFPQMITGPVSRYSQLEQLYLSHRASYENIAHGVQRILWGLLKKMVLAEYCGTIIDTVWADYTTFCGIYTWLALLLYPVQMYADFSGCMDIVIGTAKVFDITLAENFDNPFFSQTSQEFWQRWHITLGTWAKDYVLYPLLKSSWMVKWGKHLKKKFGKKKGKFIATAAGMFVLWMVVGIWHGGIRYIIGVSLWYWIILMLGDLIGPAADRFAKKYSFRTGSFGWRLFSAARTYLIYSIGALFFRADGIRDAVNFLRALIFSFNRNIWNPWVLLDGSMLNLGITFKELNVMVLCIAALFVVAVLRRKYGYAVNWIDMQPVLFRWTIYIVLLLAVLIFGAYGPGYNASMFIYGNF